MTACEEFIAACGTEVATQANVGCGEACANDPASRARILAVGNLPCPTVVPLAIDGFSLTEVCIGGEMHPHWTYDGDTGPEHWAELDEANVACGDGLEQSPIDLTGAAAAADLTFSYPTTPLTILNNGHTIQVNVDGDQTITDGAAHSYDLLQFHFHGHSEHTVDGASFPMELHMVHRDLDGNLAVVGLLIQEGAENTALADVFANLPSTEQAATPIPDVTVDPSTSPASCRPAPTPGPTTAPSPRPRAPRASPGPSCRPRSRPPPPRSPPSRRSSTTTTGRRSRSTAVRSTATDAACRRLPLTECAWADAGSPAWSLVTSQ